MDRAAEEEVHQITEGAWRVMGPDDHILLILDLDETLVYATEQPPGRAHDFAVGPYFIHRRPHLTESLTSCSVGFHLAFWSAGSDEYVRQTVARIMPPGIEPAFVWGRGRCVRSYDPGRLEEYPLKDLKKVERLGYRPGRVLIADDTPRKVHRHHGNAIDVPPFFGDPEDDILPRLSRYLLSLREETDVRRLENRGWSRSTS